MESHQELWTTQAVMDNLELQHGVGGKTGKALYSFSDDVMNNISKLISFTLILCTRSLLDLFECFVKHNFCWLTGTIRFV